MSNSLYSMLENGEMSRLALETAIVISQIQGKENITNNAFKKLSGIFFQTIQPNPQLEGSREIDNYLHTGMFFRELLTDYDKTQERKENPYRLNLEIPTVPEFINKIVPIINKISEDFSNLSKHSEEKLKQLKEFSLFICDYSGRYQQDLRRYVA